MLLSVNDIDLAVFRAINGGHLPWLDDVFLMLSSRYAAAVVAAAACCILAYRFRVGVLRAIVAAGIAVALSDQIGSRLLKHWIDRTRPCYALPEEDVRVLAHAANVGSMPSLHAANCFAVAFVLTMLDRRIALVAYPAAVLVGVSRVYNGVHWPTDVLAGAAWGTIAGLCGWWMGHKAPGVLALFKRGPAAPRREALEPGTPDALTPKKEQDSPLREPDGPGEAGQDVKRSA